MMRSIFKIAVVFSGLCPGLALAQDVHSRWVNTPIVIDAHSRVSETVGSEAKPVNPLIVWDFTPILTASLTPGICAGDQLPVFAQAELVAPVQSRVAPNVNTLLVVELLE